MKYEKSEQVKKEKSREMQRTDHNVVRMDDTQMSIHKGDPLHTNSRKRIVEDMGTSGMVHSTTKNGGRDTFSSDSRNQDEIGTNPEPKLDFTNKRKCKGGNSKLSEIGQPNVLD